MLYRLIMPGRHFAMAKKRRVYRPRIVGDKV